MILHVTQFFPSDDFTYESMDGGWEIDDCGYSFIEIRDEDGDCIAEFDGTGDEAWEKAEAFIHGVELECDEEVHVERYFRGPEYR